MRDDAKIGKRKPKMCIGREIIIDLRRHLELFDVSGHCLATTDCLPKVVYLIPKDPAEEGSFRQSLSW